MRKVRIEAEVRQMDMSNGSQYSMIERDKDGRIVAEVKIPAEFKVAHVCFMQMVDASGQMIKSREFSVVPTCDGPNGEKTYRFHVSLGEDVFNSYEWMIAFDESYSDVSEEMSLGDERFLIEHSGFFVADENRMEICPGNVMDLDDNGASASGKAKTKTHT